MWPNFVPRRAEDSCRWRSRLAAWPHSVSWQSVGDERYDARRPGDYLVVFSSPVHDRHELMSRLFVFEELAAQDVGLHERRLLLDAPHHHAEMFAAHPDGDAARLENRLHRVGDVMREVFLRL